LLIDAATLSEPSRKSIRAGFMTVGYATKLPAAQAFTTLDAAIDIVNRESDYSPFEMMWAIMMGKKRE